MSTAGPELPPHLLAKRKRQQEAERQIAASKSPPLNSNLTRSPSDSPKRRRVLGPSLPPAPLAEIPPSLPNNNPDSDSDSDTFGPSLPPQNTSLLAESVRLQREQDAAAAAASAAAQKPQREDWMLHPPTSSDWSSRVDPTKIKNRKFNTGKGSKAPAPKGGENTLWTETPEEKRQRLEDEVMGVKRPAQLGGEEGGKKDEWRERESRETGRRIQEYNEKNRNTSLYTEHNTKSKTKAVKEKEDDPSKRSFDKEKDIRGGIKIGHAQKKELLNKAADFGSRFAGGNYL